MMRIHDPYLPWIWGYAIAGMTCTAIALPGYLNQNERISLGVAAIELPAPARKIPFAFLGAVAMVAAWNETQNRRYWLEDEEEQRQQNFQLRRVGYQAEVQARMQADQYLAQMTAAERVYGQLQPYLEVSHQELIDATPTPAQLPPAPTPQTQVQAIAQPNPPPVSQPAPVQDSVPGIPIRDLSPEIARYRGHVLIASRTRSGKTTTVQAAIHQAHALYQGQADFYIFDPKGAAWCGLEQGKGYIFCNTPSHIPTVLYALQGLIQMMQARQETRKNNGGHYAPGSEPRPVIIAIDEFNTLLSLAREYDDGFPPKENPRTQVKLQRYVERFIFQGAEDLVQLWLMAQTTRVDKLGLDTSVQDNMAYFAQARNGDWQSVEDAITNNYVVSNAAERKRLWELLNVYRADPSQNLEIPLCFTTLGGNQLCKLPDLSQAKYNRVAREPSGPSPQETQENSPPKPRDNPNRPVPRGDRTAFLNQARNWIKDCWDAESPTDAEPPQSRDIPVHLKPLIDYCMGRGWVRAADIKSAVRAYRDMPADGIRALFRQSVDMGFGTVTGDGNQLYYRVDSQTFDN